MTERPQDAHNDRQTVGQTIHRNFLHFQGFFSRRYYNTYIPLTCLIGFDGFSDVSWLQQKKGHFVNNCSWLNIWVRALFRMHGKYNLFT